MYHVLMVECECPYDKSGLNSTRVEILTAQEQLLLTRDRNRPDRRAIAS